MNHRNRSAQADAIRSRLDDGMTTNSPSSSAGSGGSSAACHAAATGREEVRFDVHPAADGYALVALGKAGLSDPNLRAALEGIARNPQASGKIFVPMIVGLALIESLVIYGLLIAFQLSGKIG